VNVNTVRTVEKNTKVYWICAVGFKVTAYKFTCCHYWC